MSATDTHPEPAQPGPARAHPSIPASHMSATHAADEATDAVTARRPWTLLMVTLAAQILVVLDISVVNTALPTIGNSLRLSGGELQWLVTAYLMMSGGGLLLGGRIADLLSRRRVFLTGLTLFTLASLVSGFADTGGQLIAARAVQGLSAALLTPSALSLIMTGYEDTQRKTALALWGAVGSLGVAGGVLLGGALTSWASWQAIFWINVPIGVLALVVGRRVITNDTPERRPTVGEFDLPGAVTVISGLSALVYGLGATDTHGWWSVHTVTALTVGAALLVGFLELEQRAASPLLPPHIWKLKPLVSGTAVMLGVTGILVGVVFLASIFFQTVLGYSALETGLAFLPFALAITLGTVVARHLLGHASPRAIAAGGMLLAAAGAAWFSTAGTGAGYAGDLLPALTIVGLGVGMVFVAVSVTSMTGIPTSHAGVASGFLMTGHEVGAALGVAVLSAVASTAGTLTSPAGAADAFSRGMLGAAMMAVLVGLVALFRMSAMKVAADAKVSIHH
ncbi:MFS transporter [Nocardioides caldifontis]|uniref:MFS transporter n=1 Tax=Nocardioides caldifontis TaxID=2588938 RepID=UPI0011DFA09B|nr:MFS transporter [Nocardioides caldifontis]